MSAESSVLSNRSLSKDANAVGKSTFGPNTDRGEVHVALKRQPQQGEQAPRRPKPEPVQVEIPDGLSPLALSDSEYREKARVQPIPEGGWQDALTTIMGSLIASGELPQIWYGSIRPLFTKKSWDQERAEAIIPQIESLTSQLDVAFGSYADQQISVRNNVGQKVGWGKKLVDSFFGWIWGGNKKDAITDAGSAVVDMFSQPNANRAANSAQDALRVYLEHVKAVVPFVAKNWKETYGVQQPGRRTDWNKLKMDLNTLVYQVLELNGVDRLTNYNNFGSLQQQGGSLFYQNNLTAHYNSLAKANTDTVNHINFYSTNARPTVFGSLAFKLQFMESLYRSEGSKSFEGKMEAIRAAEAVYWWCKVNTERLRDILGDWKNNIAPVRPIGNGR